MQVASADFDIVIVGAGMAGVSIAHALAPSRSVLLLEAEPQPGYHATGRSVAFWNESYGGPGVQPLTTASGDFLRQPPAQFSDTAFMHHRGALHIGRNDDRPLAARLIADFAETTLSFEQLPPEKISAQIPGLRAGWDIGVYEHGCYDIDVAALHAAYLRGARHGGAVLQTSTALHRAKFGRGLWQIEAGGETFSARLLINAAGAWADMVAQLSGIAPTGITPLRRTVVQLATDPAPPADLPLILGLDGSFYFKADPAGRIWLTPHDETPSAPCDAAAEEIDIATAIDRFSKVVDWRVAKVEHSWAGLRSFAPDRLPVIGHDPANEHFFWLAGQGGFGIQTAPASAQLAASLITGDQTAPAGVDPARYAPNRF